MVSIKTPNMNIVRFPSSVDYNYTMSLNFLYDQQFFNNMCDPNPVLLIDSGGSSRVIEDFKTLRSKIIDLCSLSHLHIFRAIVHLQYVGTEPYDSNQMMSDIPLSLSNLKLEFGYKSNVISLTPGHLYRCYIQYLPLLPSDAMTWFLSLVTLFTTLPFDINNTFLASDSFAKFARARCDRVPKSR